jgi:C1A family cysteine protease/predicted secreted protein
LEETMKQKLMSVITVFMMASLLWMPAPVGAASAKVAAASVTVSQSEECAPLLQEQQTEFHWQVTTALLPEAGESALASAPLLESNGVTTTFEGDQLTMSGQSGMDQMRTALFDADLPGMNFLGGTVDMTVYLPADGTPVTLNLEARNTTGYAWEVVPEKGSLYAQNVAPVFTMRYEGYGAPAIQSIQLDAIGSGNTSVHLVYRRQFEADAPVGTQLNIWMPAATNLELSDPTPAELQPSASASSDAEEPSALAELLPKALPASWDWRTKGIVPPIRDQGGCGSCWAFGTVGAMESALKKSGGPLTNLSEQYLVSCNTEGWSCSGGWDSHEYHYNVKGKNQTQAGAVLESVKPYTQTNGTCNTALSHPYKLTGWGYVGGLNSSNYRRTVPTYEQLKNAIYTYGPITAGVCVGGAFQSYSGGLFKTDEKSGCYYSGYGYSPNHLIVLVGWNDADQSLILRNSWNTWWGENGYMRIKYGTSVVGIASTWVKRTSSGTAPTLYSPSGTVSKTKPSYVWSRVGTTASYKLQVYDIAAAVYKVNTTVSSSYCNSSTNRCTYTPNVLLTNNKSYKWKAAAGSGPWSAYKTFKVTVVK